MLSSEMCWCVLWFWVYLYDIKEVIYYIYFKRRSAQTPREIGIELLRSRAPLQFWPYFAAFPALCASSFRSRTAPVVFQEEISPPGVSLV